MQVFPDPYENLVVFFPLAGEEPSKDTVPDAEEEVAAQ